MTTEGNSNDNNDGNLPLPSPRAPDISHIIIERLQLENAKLRSKLQDQQMKSLKVEITGEDGSPVYATTSLEGGRWRHTYGGLWDAPDLEMEQEFDIERGGSGVPLERFGEIEIYLGGVLYASSRQDVDATPFQQDWDHDTGKEVVCQFGGWLGVWLPIRINGWHRTSWEVLRDRDAQFGHNDDFSTYDMLLQLIDNDELVGATSISFKEISFFGNCVQKLLENHDIGQKSEEEKMEDEMYSNFDDLIINTFRDAGVVGTLRHRLNAVRGAAYKFPSLQDAEDAVPRLVQLQLVSQSDDEYMSSVREEFASVIVNDEVDEENEE